MRYRAQHFYFFLFSVFVLLVAFALQKWAHLQPCILCWIQRYCWMFIGAVSLIAAVHAPRSGGRWVYTAWIALFTVLGLLSSGRQIWLQHQPPGQLISCLPSPVYLIQHLPWGQALHVIIQGSADCAKVTWRFLGLGLAQWSFIGFGFFAVWLLVVMLFKES